MKAYQVMDIVGFGEEYEIGLIDLDTRNARFITGTNDGLIQFLSDWLGWDLDGEDQGIGLEAAMWFVLELPDELELPPTDSVWWSDGSIVQSAPRPDLANWRMRRVEPETGAVTVGASCGL